MKIDERTYAIVAIVLPIIFLIVVVALFELFAPPGI
jgi:hypothetical protein